MELPDEKFATPVQRIARSPRRLARKAAEPGEKDCSGAPNWFR